MVRPARFEHPGHARFLTFSCFRRLPLLGNPGIRDLFLDHLRAARAECAFRLHAWVVMPEHVHLILRPAPHSDVPTLLRITKEPFARTVVKRWRELRAPVLERIATPAGGHRFWQRGGGFDRNIWSRDTLIDAIASTHANPVRRGLAQRAVDWPWSSARAWASEPCDLAPDPLPG